MNVIVRLEKNIASEGMPERIADYEMKLDLPVLPAKDAKIEIHPFGNDCGDCPSLTVTVRSTFFEARDGKHATPVVVVEANDEAATIKEYMEKMGWTRTMRRPPGLL